MRDLKPALAALLGTALFLWPARAGLLGDPFGEAHNHLAAHGQALLDLRVNYPAGWDVPLMDPPNLPIFALGWLVSPVVAYNGMVVANVLLAALGGWQLGHETGGRPGAWVGMAAVAWSPFLSGVIDFGVSESWPLGWYALHLAAMLRLRREPSLGRAAWAGLSLGIFALSGWYHAAFALVVAPLLALHVRRRELWLTGLVALALVLPRFVDLLPHLDVWAGRAAGLSDPGDIRAWTRTERYGIDLFMFGPATEVVTPSYTVYLGVATVGLAVLGGRAALPYLGMAMPLWVLALGHWLRAGGELLADFPMPAGWLVSTFDSAQFVTHWYRAAGPATVLLAAAAATGASRARLPAAVLAAGILADSLWLSHTRWPRVAAPLSFPPEAAEMSAMEGPIFELPVDANRGSPERAGSRRPYWIYQLRHHQPVAEHYEGADAALRLSGQARALQAACGGLPRPRPGAPDEGSTAPGSEGVSLHDLGFRHVVVHPALAPSGCADAVEAALGPRAGTTSWTLRAPG
ncbi:MAG: hypothetical protein FJ090_09560 [Deltaproteobacteria bacterium]|nr:hypothetical protein [Deltaproteobacteria bacterium]